MRQTQRHQKRQDDEPTKVYERLNTEKINLYIKLFIANTLCLRTAQLVTVVAIKKGSAKKKMETFAYTHVFPRTPIYFQRATGCPTRMKRVSRRASPLPSRATASESGNALDTSMPKNTFQTMTSLASMAAIFAYHHILKYFEARKNTRLQLTLTVYYMEI